ncbi:MAG: aminotransferase class V-fold PLP-dependent enzyme [Stygiobacter sp.]|jgi:selenocysteine lyase/cysteine desulfurase|uniref:Aminotransferase class V-fold PLP-dependent enzyme n=1 Tax=Stygiobacter electus TaxID=3032292 RepID=A0AAE3TE76_9BACT|nr:aminotransferase class V-fold PLP-dependent enzyme [Stygiobacter electus]MDF1612167.1 aminotransferase class V-fold PLP-dependent enzyme [Stygiobacter electus]
MELEKHFNRFRENIIGINHKFQSPFGEKEIIYADWIASGRLYFPIEKTLVENFYPLVGNTHSETSETGTTMTKAYHETRQIIKKHVNASSSDVLLFAGYGMTAAINKFQRILGLRIPEQLQKYTSIPKEEKPIVFLTHMEHHSNQTSWLETICDVVIIEPDELGLVNLNHFKHLLDLYKNRKVKIASLTAASNVTGIEPPIYEMAKMIHEYDGLCFVDYAAAAPYIKIDMHPEKPEEKLDAIFFSPHKFLGGPGSSGVLIFDSKLYNIKVPDHPGGGTVDWTNPWGLHKYIDDIEQREDGGTPGFLQAIKAALAIKLKEEMDIEKINLREKELFNIAFERLLKIPSLHILAQEHKERLGVISFYIEDIHYNLMVKLLNDRYGIQVRGGCSCAGTYGHYLLHIDPTRSKRITDKINQGDLTEKPGWVRLSLHPTMTNYELEIVLNGIEEIIHNITTWKKDYIYSNKTNEYHHKDETDEHQKIRNMFKIV